MNTMNKKILRYIFVCVVVFAISAMFDLIAGGKTTEVALKTAAIYSIFPELFEIVLNTTDDNHPKVFVNSGHDLELAKETMLEIRKHLD